MSRPAPRRSRFTSACLDRERGAAPCARTVRRCPLGRSPGRVAEPAGSLARRAARRRPLRLSLGEVGIGKTRLAEEMLYWAGQQGIAIAATRGYADGGSLAYAPLTELLRAEALRPHVGQLAEVWRSELARLLPELLVEDPRLPRPEPLTAALAGAAHVRCRRPRPARPDRPLILFLDDLQWFDAETIAWLHYLLHAEQQATHSRHVPRLLVLAALRREEIGEGHPVARLLLDLRRGDS